MDEPGPQPQTQPVVVVGPDGRPLGFIGGQPGGTDPDDPGDHGDGGQGVVNLIEQPAKVMRIGSMLKQLLEEARAAPLDDAGRARLRDIHDRSIKELEAGLAPELVDELERITLPFNDGTVPSDAELRIAQAQLVGWLEGLFQGIQTALFAQQMAARAQFEEIRRRALPPGAQSPDDTPIAPPRGGGPYL